MSNVAFLQKLPNALTYLRLFLVPIFVLIMSLNFSGSNHYALIVFIVAAITDFWDGWIARRYRAVSEVGKLLDPLVDKILVMAALVMLLARNGSPDGRIWAPDWLVVLILAREIWITGLRSVAATKGHVMAASSSGRYKSWFQMLAICFLLYHEPATFFSTAIDFYLIGLVLLTVSVVFALWSGVKYTIQVVRML